MMFLKRLRLSKPTFSTPLAPDVPFYAVGDIHGRDDLLARLLDQLGGTPQPATPLICVGDYIDRGDDSAAVLRRLFRMQRDAGNAMVCLRGNHEEMLLSFLDAPAQQGARWLRYGGLQTLASFRLAPIAATAPEADWNTLRDQLEEAMGEELVAWLRDLPFHWQTGNVVVTHAGADPGLPLEEQSPETLLWGHPEFESAPRQDGLWIVHGHTIVDQPMQNMGRISVDTGAYATGRLSAARVEEAKVTFVTA